MQVALEKSPNPTMAVLASGISALSLVGASIARDAHLHPGDRKLRDCTAEVGVLSVLGRIVVSHRLLESLGSDDRDYLRYLRCALISDLVACVSLLGEVKICVFSLTASPAAIPVAIPAILLAGMTYLLKTLLESSPLAGVVDRITYHMCILSAGTCGPVISMQLQPPGDLMDIPPYAFGLVYGLAVLAPIILLLGTLMPAGAVLEPFEYPLEDSPIPGLILVADIVRPFTLCTVILDVLPEVLPAVLLPGEVVRKAVAALGRSVMSLLGIGPSGEGARAEPAGGSGAPRASLNAHRYGRRGSYRGVSPDRARRLSGHLRRGRCRDGDR
ncbi:hypothetical protein [Methanopyrus kandleri]